MKKQGTTFRATKYLANAAMYQPDQGQTRRTVSLVLLLLTVLLIGIATRAHAEETPANYMMQKGSVYSTGTSAEL
ncbi:MAG: hypothetical protein A2075_04545 [Geobacteraceae bacterium GWC2_58_44]|nr:MAG: hypothetical protein A2075_04545 [Geobacteraceae bacterium GWC2_58_44]HBG05523.1 hypothetical protein [Geobacter sp.]